MANPKPVGSVATQFQPGNGGGGRNPAKRRAGEVCWNALLDDFTVNGVAAIETMRLDHPSEYVKLVASGLPAEKSIDLNVKNVENLSEEQSRLMAESIIEQSKRRIATSEGRANPVHGSVPAGLPTS